MFQFQAFSHHCFLYFKHFFPEFIVHLAGCLHSVLSQHSAPPHRSIKSHHHYCSRYCSHHSTLTRVSKYICDIIFAHGITPQSEDSILLAKITLVLTKQALILTLVWFGSVCVKDVLLVLSRTEKHVTWWPETRHCQERHSRRKPNRQWHSLQRIHHGAVKRNGGQGTRLWIGL